MGGFGISGTDLTHSSYCRGAWGAALESRAPPKSGHRKRGFPVLGSRELGSPWTSVCVVKSLRSGFSWAVVMTGRPTVDALYIHCHCSKYKLTSFAHCLGVGFLDVEGQIEYLNKLNDNFECCDHISWLHGLGWIFCQVNNSHLKNTDVCWQVLCYPKHTVRNSNIVT